MEGVFCELRLYGILGSPFTRTCTERMDNVAPLPGAAPGEALQSASISLTDDLVDVLIRPPEVGPTGAPRMLDRSDESYAGLDSSLLAIESVSGGQDQEKHSTVIGRLQGVQPRAAPRLAGRQRRGA